MNTEKGIAKTIIVAIVVIALVVTMIFVLKGCRKDLPTQGDEISQNDPDSNVDDSSEADPAVTLYTVIFKDYDGTVLKEQDVEKGKSATAPADPKREHFKFAGWDKSFEKITSNLIVTATYTTTKTVIYAEHVTIDKGTKKVTMKIRVINNPGILGAVLKVSVDDKVFSFKEVEKTKYPGFTLTSPGSKTTTSPYTFVLDALELSKEDKKDDTLFTITFKVKDTADAGKYNVKLSYDKGAVFGEDYKDPKVVLENGTITIK